MTDPGKARPLLLSALPFTREPSTEGAGITSMHVLCSYHTCDSLKQNMRFYVLEGLTNCNYTYYSILL